MMNIYSQKISEVQKYGTMTGHVYSWVVLVVGKKFYDSLTPEQQTIMQESADIAIAYMAESVAKDDETAREEMAKTGLVFVEPSEEFKTKLFLDCWMYAHGFSTLIATNYFKDVSDDFIKERLVEGAATMLYKRLRDYNKKN
jgi:TRAP-type mannitol/chloroaromatic compound transport system substrate-binding protein